MTKLEEEIFEALKSVQPQDHVNAGHALSKAAAQVAKRYIKRAILDTFQNHTDAWKNPDKAMDAEDFYDFWLKENGITE